jgi:hypothetical protein
MSTLTVPMPRAVAPWDIGRTVPQARRRNRFSADNAQRRSIAFFIAPSSDSSSNGFLK